MLVEITGNKDKEQLTTTSRIVAEVFEKEHKNVIRDIEELLHKDWLKIEPMFTLSSYQEHTKRLAS